MFATAVRLSKASRRPMTSKQGNKDFYKGTRQSALPGDRRTGAPGRHIVKGKGKYMLDDTKVRFFVAPPLPELDSTPLKPYVAASTELSEAEKAIEGPYRMKVRGVLTADKLYNIARQAAYQRLSETHAEQKTAMIYSTLPSVKKELPRSNS